MTYDDFTQTFVPDGNPLPGDDPDVTPPVGDPMPGGPSEPSGDPTF